MSTAPASEMLVQQLDAIEPTQHARFLRELLGSVAACLVFTEGQERATEALYSVADSLAVLNL